MFPYFSAFEFKNRLLDRRWCYKNSHVFGTHQKPEKLRYTIEHTSDWVCGRYRTLRLNYFWHSKQ